MGQIFDQIDNLNKNSRPFFKNSHHGILNDVKGYRIEECFGAKGCPNCAAPSIRLVGDLVRVLEVTDFSAFLKQNMGEKKMSHLEFRISISECPNGCSQPQIKDIGIIGSCRVNVTHGKCNYCRNCIVACKEGAIQLADLNPAPQIDWTRCLYCGQCARVCNTGALSAGDRGFRILIAGKLGRHPRLAFELPGVYSEKEVCEIVRKCIKLYKLKSNPGKRFADVVSLDDVEMLT